MSSNLTEQVKSTERHQEALKLRIEGKSYAFIAQVLGFSGPPAACNAVKAGMRKALLEPAHHLRDLELARLDVLYEKSMELMNQDVPVIVNGKPLVKDDGEVVKVQDPNVQLKAITAALRVLERRSALAGLDAPKKVQATVENPPQTVVYLPDNGRESGQ